MVDYLNPDVMILVETKMDSSVNYSEFLRASYKGEITKDRFSHGGGVMIAYKDTLAVVEAEIPLVDAVMVWVKAELDDNEVVYIGAYYRAPSDRTCDTLDDLHKVIGSLPKNSHMVLGGDFNAGDIRWDTNTVAPNSDRRGLCEWLLEVIDDHQLEQRESAVLDLYCTNRPGLVKYRAILTTIWLLSTRVSDSGLLKTETSN